MNDHAYMIDASPLTLHDYARARAEAIAEDPAAIMLLTPEQLADAMRDWFAICEAAGHERPLPFALAGAWMLLDPEESPEDDDGGLELRVMVTPGATLCEAANRIEAQVITELFHRSGGDLDAVAQALLGEAGQARKVQLRANQLGLKLRELRRELRGAA